MLALAQADVVDSERIAQMISEGRQKLVPTEIGTVGTAGTIVHRVTPVYGWE